MNKFSSRNVFFPFYLINIFGFGEFLLELVMANMRRHRHLAFAFLVSLFFVYEFSPANAQQETYDGPFGLMFGQSVDSVEYERLRKVDINYAGPGFSCESDIRSINAPNADVEKLYKSAGLSISILNELSRNALGADFSARLSAAIYNIPVQDGLSEMCLAFFDDRLFFIHMRDEQYRRYNDVLEASLDSKYGKGSVYVNNSGDLVIENWKSTDEILSIKKVTSTAGGDLTYVYNPIKREQIFYLLETYIEHHKKAVGVTDF